MRKSEQAGADVAVVGGGVAGLSEAGGLEPRAAAGGRAARRCPREGRGETRLLVRALAASAEHYGARLLAETAADGVRVVGGRAVGVSTPKGFVSAGAVVLAAGAR